MKKLFALTLAAVLFGSCMLLGAAEPAPYGDDEIVVLDYTLENAMDIVIDELHVYESKGKNLAGEDGLAPGEQITTDVSGYYLRTPDQTLYTVEYTADGETYTFDTLHVEDMFNVLYLKAPVDGVTGATPVFFTNPDGSAQAVEAVEAPAEDEIVTRTYTLENAMDTTITELYVYKSDKGNIAPEGGLQPGVQVTTEVFGYYLRTPNATLYTVDFTAGGENYRFETLHVEELFEVLYLTGPVDGATGATPIAFAAPAA